MCRRSSLSSDRDGRVVGGGGVGDDLRLPHGVLGDDGDGALNYTTQGLVTLAAALAGMT